MGAIKFFQAAQNGAPQLSGTNGSLIDLLDAVLVNGYGQLSVLSITRSDAVALVTTGVLHTFESGDSVMLSGATQPEYNGEFVVSVTGPTTFTIQVAGSPVTPATGDLLVKRAPAGFSKVFSATNKAVYRSNDLTGLRHYLQVIDDGTSTGGAKEARIRGFVSMTSIDNGIEPFPTTAQTSVGLISNKSNVISAAVRPWKLISDGKTFYFSACMDQAPATQLETGGYIWWTAFGDLIPTRPGDAYSSFVAGCSLQNAPTSTNQNGLYYTASRSFSGAVAALSMPRDWNNSVGAVWCAALGHGWDEIVAGGVALFAYPHPQDNGFYMTPYSVGQRGVMRGRFPGVFEPLQGRCLSNYDIVENIDGYEGRKFIGLYGVCVTTNGMLMYDTTGPWS